MTRIWHALSIAALILVLVEFGFFPLPLIAQSDAPIWEEIQPILESKCYECHGGDETKGDVDLKVLADGPKMEQEHELWEDVLDSIDSGDMPPSKAESLLEAEKQSILKWIEHSLNTMASTNPGDPGPVTMRRLTNGEYDRTIRDLTGRSYNLSAEFQADGGGGEGFSNTGDVLFFSSASLDKYFAAARLLADYATFLPAEGPVFHDSRVGLRGPEQIKAQVEQNLYVWYQDKSAPHLPKDTDDLRIRDYLTACWQHRYQKLPLDQLAKDNKLVLPFLENWWKLLNSTEPKSRYLDILRLPWRAMPGPDPAKPAEIPDMVKQRALAIEADQLSWNNPKKPGHGVQRWQQDVDGIRPYAMQGPTKGQAQITLCFGDAGDGNKGDIALVKKIEVFIQDKPMDYWGWLNSQIGELTKQVTEASKAEEGKEAKDSKEIESQKKRLKELEAARALFGKHPQEGRKIDPKFLAVAAPDTVTLPLPEKSGWVKAETWLDQENPDAEEATIQWEMTTKKPRDLTKVLPGVLTIWKVRSPASQRTMEEFSHMRQALPDMFERRLEQVARNIYRPASGGLGIYYFNDEQLGRQLGEQAKQRLAELKKDWWLVTPGQLNEEQTKAYDHSMIGHLHRFASLAWRRPLENGEKEALAAFYQDILAQGLDRESAGREGLVRILVSPNFLFKAETMPEPEAQLVNADGDNDIPLNSWEIASRLSYFLWSSCPDEALRKDAAANKLRDPAVLASQLKRMVKDKRSLALAEEFAGQWLKFSDFERHDGVDTNLFPEMTPELRDDMKRESVEFFRHFFQEDRRVMDIALGETTFLNERLAAFYGVPNVTGPKFREVKVTDQHRGGVLGMASLLTKTSRPERTSPILRGDYLFSVILGYSSPPPPPNVPELGNADAKPSSLREAMALHSQEKSCAVCHVRIDPLGFSLESFDPIGRFRELDEGGGKIDDTGILPDGTTFKGIKGLRDQIRKDEAQFTRNFCRKLLGYALGRSVLPTDDDLLTAMAKALEANDGRVSAAMLEIVTSRQFLNKRNEAATLASAP